MGKLGREMDQQPDVVRMSPEYEKKHLDKILDKLARLQVGKALAIASGKKDVAIDIGVRITEVRQEYETFKKGYRQ